MGRKSKSIKIAGLLGLASLFIASCEHEHYRHCVDNNGKVMPDSLCNCRDENNNYRPGFGMGYMPFLWYYGSRRYGYGDFVGGGSYMPSAGVSYSSPGIGRGGFGGSARGGGGGEGGHGGGAGE